MIKIGKIVSLLLVLALMISAVGCQKEDEAVELNISAAASLTEAMGEIQTKYQEENPNVSIVLNFGSSGSLQNQIEQGAPTDVFLSASLGKMQTLQDESLLNDDDYVELLENTMVLIAPNDGGVITSFDDLTTVSDYQFAMGEPESVPAGKYAAQVLESMGITDLVEPHAVYGKDVKEVLTWVESGDADAGMVYSTDAKTSDDVQVLETAGEDTHDPIIYPAAVVKATEHLDEAQAFVDYLSTDEAKAIFEAYGFTAL